MRALLQRVSEASVRVDAELVGSIDRGFLVLLGVHRNDGEGDALALARKVAALRVFPDQDGKMNRSIADVGGSVLVVSQFTLYADVSRGRRPSFVDAAPPDRALHLYTRFVESLLSLGIPTCTGRFQATMAVSLVNDGPVTILLESDEGEAGHIGIPTGPGGR